MNSDTQDFLDTLLQLADTGERETRHVRDWTVHQFHPEFVSAVDSFISGFREYLAGLAEDDSFPGESHLAFDDPDAVTNGTFGGNVFLSLSGHGAGFWDTPESEPLQAALEAYAGGKYRFEQLGAHSLAKFSGKIHLAYRTAAFRREYLAKLFTPAVQPLTA